MRIGIVSPEFPPMIGGVESYAYGYARALVDMGHEVTIFTTAASATCVIDDAAVVPELKVFLAADRELLDDDRVDAWHVMNAAYAWLAAWSSKPTVVSVHGNDFLHPYVRPLRPQRPRHISYWRVQSAIRIARGWLGGYLTKRSVMRSLPAATRIITNSHYTEQVLLKMIPACAGKTTVAYVGIDDRWFASPLAPRTQSEVTNFLTVARLSEPRKNIDVVLRALSELRREFSFDYTIVGDGYLRPALEQLSTELGLGDRVHFRGFLETDALHDAFKDADLFVLTSSILPRSHEGFGIVYLEANACGVPVLAARLAGAVDAVNDGVSGYFVDEISPASVSASLRRFMQGKLRFEPTACRAFAQDFVWPNVVERVIPYYASNS